MQLTAGQLVDRFVTRNQFNKYTRKQIRFGVVRMRKKASMEPNPTSPHILNTSANLFGLCFVVFTSLKALKLGGDTVLDEVTAASMLLFMVSCCTSFLSIRSKSDQRSKVYESIADYVFMAGLATLFITTVFIVFKATS